MVVLKPVLLVRDLPYSWHRLRQRLPSLGEFACPDAHPSEQAVLRYLRQGAAVGLDLDRTLFRDALSPGTRIDRSFGVEVVQTDGVWVWGGALAYYVERYHVRLPEQFLAHAEASAWRIGPVAGVFDLSLFEATDQTPGVVIPAPPARSLAAPAS